MGQPTIGTFTYGEQRRKCSPDQHKGNQLPVVPAGIVADDFKEVIPRVFASRHTCRTWIQGAAARQDGVEGGRMPVASPQDDICSRRQVDRPSTGAKRAAAGHRPSVVNFGARYLIAYPEISVLAPGSLCGPVVDVTVTGYYNCISDTNDFLMRLLVPAVSTVSSHRQAIARKSGHPFSMADKMSTFSPLDAKVLKVEPLVGRMTDLINSS